MEEVVARPLHQRVPVLRLPFDSLRLLSLGVHSYTYLWDLSVFGAGSGVGQGAAGLGPVWKVADACMTKDFKRSNWCLRDAWYRTTNRWPTLCFVSYRRLRPEVCRRWEERRLEGWVAYGWREPNWDRRGAVHPVWHPRSVSPVVDVYRVDKSSTESR